MIRIAFSRFCLAALSLSLLSLLACGRGPTTGEAAGGGPAPAGLAARCAPGRDLAPDRDDFQHRVVFTEAKNVEVTYHGHYKVVRLRNSASRNDAGFGETLVLVRCGTPVPPLEGELEGAAVFYIPVATVATNAVSDLARLRELGLAANVVGVPDEAIYDEDFHRRFLAGELAAIGHPGHGEPNLEALIAAAPDLTLLFSTGPEHAAGLARARLLGLQVAPSYAFTEKTYLGQAEWLKYVALFFDAEERAEAVFAAMASRYHELSRRAREAARDEPRTVFWGGSAGGNRWWTESSGPAAGLIEDAGAKNLLADPEAGPFATLETATVLERAADADLWLTSALDQAEWDERLPLEHFRSYREGRVFHNRGRYAASRNASDWNETALVRPDLALEDLVSLLHPQLTPGHRPMFFAPVARAKATR